MSSGQELSNSVKVITLGCSKNTVDSERLMRQIEKNNITIDNTGDTPDTVIINTCGFIDAAKEESINEIIKAVANKKAGNIKKVIVAGCLSERYRDDLINDIPEIDSIFGVEDYEGIVTSLGGKIYYDLLGERSVTTPQHFAYLKISEGCDNPCSFCAIPLMRGGHISYPIERLVKETEHLAVKGVKELILIGQDTTDYGKDIYGKYNLAALLQALSAIEGIEMIRLMYAYPSHFPDDVIDELANNPKMCKYLDIPLQHISDNCLKSMRRGITKRRTVELLNTLRERVPGIAIRTTFITGYPAETDADFKELLEFIKEFEFERLGVFTFSVEENTPSYVLGDPVSARTKENRRKKLMEAQKEISERKNSALIDSIQRVIIDRVEDGTAYGRTYRDAPEVDGEVIITPCGGIKTGDIAEVEITDSSEYDLFATLKS